MIRRAKNKEDMRSMNRQAILNAVNKRPLSRAGLARLTGLTRAGVGLIVDELIQEGTLAETGPGTGELGRKPILLDIRADRHHALAMDLSRTGCRIGVTDLKGRVLAAEGVDIAGLDPERALDAVAAALERMAATTGVPRGSLLGLGVGAPGPLDAVSGTILNPPDFACWHDVPVVSGLARRLSLPVFLDNNASALALAERNLGLGSELDGFLLLVVDSGVGAGIVIHDELYRGNGGFGSEIGHTSIAMEGRPCSCGHRGCLERYAAIPEILGQLSASARPAASWEEVVDRAMEGDADCLALVDREASYLAVAIVNAMNLLELEAVVLAGAVRYRPALLLERLAPYVRERAMTRTLHRLRIESSPIDREPGIVSAAAIVIDRFFRGGSST